MIGSFGVRHHQYADDTQMYIAALKSDLKANIDPLEKCTAAVHQWLLHNGLQLNPSKSEVIQFTAGRGREQVDEMSLEFTFRNTDRVAGSNVIRQIVPIYSS